MTLLGPTGPYMVTVQMTTTSFQEWKDKLEEAQKAIEALKEEQSRKQEMMKTIPHITNLNGDEQLCGMIVYFFGEKNANHNSQ